MTLGDRLPFVAEAEDPLTEAELNVLRTQYASEGKDANVQTKFNLAWGLIKCRERQFVQEGIQILNSIIVEYPDRRRECQYYIALGNYKLGNYTEARVMNSYILDQEPHNIQALALKNLIEKRVSRGLMGLFMVGGLVAAIGVGAAYLFRKQN
ncbi:mitochondrial fission protein [Neoconidiobolus thromboides FSU 785]|nr:mitochondrial fission protein [Neoconidiobolus thromboides FSU 785]